MGRRTGPRPAEDVILAMLAEATHQKAWQAARLLNYLAQHGEEFLWRPLPADVRRGPVGECWQNAQRLALAEPDRWRYCEGYAEGDDGWIRHAWLLDRRGYVQDVTWLAPSRYFGVIIPVEVVAAAYARRGSFTPLLTRWGRDPAIFAAGAHQSP